MQGQQQDSTRPMAGNYAWVQQTTPELRISANCSRTNPHSHSSHSNAELRLIVALQGSIQLSFGRQSFRLQPRHQAQVLLVNLNEQELFERHCGSGSMEQKVCMALGHGWLEQHGLPETGSQSPLARLASRHLAAMQWAAGPQLTRLALQMVQHRAVSPC
ncbi:hypothetical protein ACFSQE_00085 [Vogesella fluminis]|uniref:hypothetical protein n=1 Tax=Vogesella fluminis TaxID=1069161 RepID=UPI00362FC91C